MNCRTRLGVLVAMSTSILGACATQNDNLNSTLWIQTASEYRANSIQTYAAAQQMIDEATADKSWTAAIEQNGDYGDLPEAVIMDIDETVLDNSKYQAQLIKRHSEYNNATWDRWVSLQQAPAVPGAVAFVKSIRGKGIKAIFITNRECERRDGVSSACPQEQDTIKNLAKVGIEGVTKEDLLLKNEVPGWGSEKQSRREYVVARYRVLMLFGDDFGDFLPNVKKDISPAKRNDLVVQHQAMWGTRWFMLSNPTYGSWLRILKKPRSQYLEGYE